jgi:hypothetical protein
LQEKIKLFNELEAILIQKQKDKEYIEEFSKKKN